MDDEVHNMRNGSKRAWKSIAGGLVLVLFAVGAVVTPYMVSLSEPVKVVLLGAVLVGIAIWGRRYLKEPANP